MTLVVHATFPIEPEHRERALELVRELAEASRREDGIREYRVTTDVDDPNLLCFFEWYEDEAAFGDHTRTDHFRTFEEALPDLLAGEPTVTHYEVDSASEMDI